MHTEERTKLFWERVLVGSFSAGGYFGIRMEDLQYREHQMNIWDAICIIKPVINAEQIQLHIVIAKNPKIDSLELPYEKKPKVENGIRDSNRLLKKFNPVRKRLMEICRAF
jgi:hypothetical protein